MNTDFDFSNYQTHMIEVETYHPKFGTCWELCELQNETDVEEFNEMINGYQTSGVLVGWEIIL